MSHPRNYDPKCEELARHFLGENAEEKAVVELANAFQFQAECVASPAETVWPKSDGPDAFRIATGK